MQNLIALQVCNAIFYVFANILKMGRTAPRITWTIISMTRVQPSLQTFGTIFGTRKLFSKKYTHAGSLVNTTLPACHIYYFTLQILKSSAQNPFRAEDFCSIIIERVIKAHRCDTDFP